MYTKHFPDKYGRISEDRLRRKDRSERAAKALMCAAASTFAVIVCVLGYTLTAHFSIWIVVAVALLYILLTAISKYTDNIFSYPYFTHTIDITGKGVPDMSDIIDAYLLGGGIIDIELHEKFLEGWEAECRRAIDKSAMPSFRHRQFEDIRDPDNCYRFELMRTRTEKTLLENGSYRLSERSYPVCVITCSKRDLLSRLGVLNAMKEGRIPVAGKLLEKLPEKSGKPLEKPIYL